MNEAFESEQPLEQLQPPAEAPGWHFRLKAFGLFLLGIVCVILANVIGGIAGQKLAGGHTLAADMLYRIFTTAALIAVYAILLRYLDRERGSALAAMGLPAREGWLRESLWGVGIGFGVVSIAVAAIATFGHIGIHAALSPVAERRFVEVTIMLLFGAMMEELMFRGYPFQRLVDAVGRVGAILIFSALFGAAHLKNPNAGGLLSWGFFNTIAVGVVFSIAYLKFRTLWLPWGFHFGWNFSLGVIYGLPVSGISFFSVIVRSTATGSSLLTGGSYGIEASLTGAIVILIGLGIVLVLPARQNKVLPFASEPLRPEMPAGEPNRI